MNPPIYPTRLLATLLGLALCLPSNSYALRPLNAGMEESPVRRELEEEFSGAITGFQWAVTASVLLGVATLGYVGVTHLRARYSDTPVRNKLVVPPHRELPQPAIAAPEQTPVEPDSTPLPWTSEKGFNQWREMLVALERSSPETIDSVLQYLDDLRQEKVSSKQWVSDYNSWKKSPDQASLKPYQQQAVKDGGAFLTWLSSLERETGGNPKKMAELLKWRIPELEKQQRRASELLERHLAEDPGFFSWFLNPSDAEETKNDLASYVKDKIRKATERWTWYLLEKTPEGKEKLRLLTWEDEFWSRSRGPDVPEYVKQLRSDKARQNRFGEVFRELFEDLETGTGSFSGGSENSPQRFARVLQSSSFVPAEQKLAQMDPEKRLEAVLGRLPILFELVKDGTVSAERALERLDSVLASIGQQRLAEPLGQLIRWAAKEKMDPEKIDAVLTELGVLLNQRDFHLIPSNVHRSDPLWNSWLFKIALRGTVGGKEILFVQRLRGNKLTTLRGYHPLGNERKKDVGIVMLDEALQAARDLLYAADTGSVSGLLFLGIKDSDKQLERQLGQMLRRFADEGILPLDDLELWKQMLFSTVVHEYTHAVGYSDEYEARLAALAVGNPVLTLTDLYDHRHDDGERRRSYAYRAAERILSALEYWRSSPLDADGSALRRLSGTLLNETTPRLFNHFNSPAIQRDLKVLTEQISTLQPKESLRDQLMGGRLPADRSGLEENLARISQVAAGVTPQRFLLGIGPEQTQKFGPDLIRFLDDLKRQQPVLDPFIFLIGDGAESYAESPSVLLAVSRMDEAVQALSWIGAGTLAYWGGLEETGLLIQQLQSREIPISVSRIESDRLADVLSLILGNLAGLEENFSSLEVEALYGIRLSELADQLEQLAQIGV